MNSQAVINFIKNHGVLVTVTDQITLLWSHDRVSWTLNLHVCVLLVSLDRTCSSRAPGGWGWGSKCFSASVAASAPADKTLAFAFFTCSRWVHVWFPLVLWCMIDPSNPHATTRKKIIILAYPFQTWNVTWKLFNKSMLWFGKENTSSVSRYSSLILDETHSTTTTTNQYSVLYNTMLCTPSILYYKTFNFFPSHFP